MNWIRTLKCKRFGGGTVRTMRGVTVIVVRSSDTLLFRSQDPLYPPKELAVPERER